MPLPAPLGAVLCAALASGASAAADAAASLPPPIPQAQPPRYFNQTLDHFNPLSQPPASGAASTFPQRYYLDASAWKGAAALGPILFIPGGEWSVGPTKGLLYGQ
eukprot:SAG22_NODE_11338_length_490_cov_0.531969_1_plen_104_part_10